MDTTDCLGLPFPECDPPLVKDASNIEQFRDLAFAVDDAVENLSDLITDTLLQPDAVIMTGGVTTTGSDVTHFYSGISLYDNAGMANTTLDLIEIQTDGWYLIGGWVRCSGAASTIIGLRIEPLLNGDYFTSRQGPGFVNLGNESVNWTDSGYFRAGDRINAMTHHTDNPATSRTYATQIWALLVLANV